MPRSLAEVATDLAAEYAPDLVPPAAEPWDDIVFAPRPVLSPGIDIHDDIVYATVPVVRREEQTVGRGKSATSRIVERVRTIVVTSDKRTFWYEPDDLERHGFAIHDQFTQSKKTDYWSAERARSYVKGDATPVDAFALFSRIRDLYTRHIEYADERYYDLVSVFVPATYLFRAWPSMGYLHFNGTKASGKSANVQMLTQLAFNTVWASSMTESVMFRVASGSPGLIVVDEAEEWDSERAKAVRSLALSGYKRGGSAWRAEKTDSDKWSAAEFSVYGPKAFASINPLDATLASRCIIVKMRPAIRRIPNIDPDAPVWADVRDALYRFALDNGAAIKRIWVAEQQRHERAAETTITNREWEAAAPLIILADFMGGTALRKTVEDFLAEYFAEARADAQETDRTMLVLRCLPRLLATKTNWGNDYYKLSDLHEIVSEYLDEDQRQWFTTRSASKALVALGFTQKRAHRSGTQFQLSPNPIRAAFANRRIDPFPEDAVWLDGTDYAPPDNRKEDQTDDGFAWLDDHISPQS